MGLDNLQNGISSVIGKIEAVVGENPGAAIGSAAAVGSVIGAAAVGVIGSGNRHKKKTHRKKARKVGRKNKHRGSAKGKLTHHRHRKGKHHSKGIHYTKKGQPYIIMASGKARFIKKSGARRSKKMKGGRY